MAGSAEAISGVDEKESGSSRFYIRTDVLVWLAVLALIVSAGVKLWRLNSRELWLDETESWYNSSLHFAEMMRYNAGDTHPPLYFILLWIWMRIAGDAQTQLRLFGVLLNICSTVAMFFLGRRVLGPRFGALAAVLFAYSPMLFVYSLELRMYMMSICFFACLLIVHWMLVVEQRDSKWLVVGYSLLAALVFYVHYMGVFVLLGLFAHWAVTCSSRDRLKRLGAATALIALLVSPCIPLVVHQRKVKLDFYRTLEASRQNPSALTYSTVDSSARSGEAGLAGSAAVVAGFYPARSPALLLLCAAPMVAILAGIAFLGLTRGDQTCRLCLFVSLAVAMGLFVLHIGATRYMLPAVPPLVLGIARVVQYWSTTARWRVAGVAAGAFVLCAYGAGYFRQTLLPHGRPWENLMGVLQQNYKPGDTVVFEALYTQVPFDYFARHQDFHPQETGFPLSIYDWWERQPLKTWGGPVILHSDLDRFVSGVQTSNTKTVWLVLHETSYYDPHDALLARLGRIGQVTEFQLPPEPRAYAGESSPRLIRVSLR